MHLVASAPTGAWLEYMPWADTLLENAPVMVDGGIRVPDRPGFGLQFNADHVKRVLQETQTFS